MPKWIMSGWTKPTLKAAVIPGWHIRNLIANWRRRRAERLSRRQAARLSDFLVGLPAETTKGMTTIRGRKVAATVKLDYLIDNFGTIIHDARVRAKMSGHELAGRTGVAVTTIFRIESGANSPGTQIIAKILRVLYSKEDGKKMPRVPAPALKTHGRKTRSK